jgi:3',5'-cyclic AMP phosphodiesterase CpdA
MFMPKVRGAFTVAVCLTFLAARATAQDKPTGDPIGILLAAGDIAGCDRSKDKETAEILSREIKAAEARNIPVRVLALGDLAYPDGDSVSFTCFEKNWGEHRKVMLAVPGNHDMRTKSGGPYFAFFADSPVMPEDKSRKGYYWVDFPAGASGAWRLIGVNTNKEYGAKEPQMIWLGKELEATKNRCVLIFSHAFRFSSGHHGHNDGKSKKAVPQTALKAAFDLLHRHHGSVVLSGHDHHFEQLGPQDVNGKAAKDGIRSFVVGTGGFTPYKEYKTFAQNSEHRAWKTLGILKMELFPQQYAWSFIKIDGTTLSLNPSWATCNTRP